MLVLLIDRYMMPPGACSICGNAEGRAIDTLREIDEFFRVYVCEQCVRHMAGMVGMVDGDLLLAGQSEAEAARREIAALTEKLAAARDTVRSMQVAGFVDDPMLTGIDAGEEHVCEQCGFTAATGRALGQHKRIHSKQEVKV